MRRILAAAAVLIACHACAPAPPAPFTAADSLAVDRVRTALTAAWNAGNVDAATRLYAAAAEIQVPERPPIRGTADIADYYNTQLGTPLRPSLDLGRAVVTARDGLAVMDGSLDLTPKTGPPHTGKYLMVLRRQAGGTWSIQYHAMSFNEASPPAGSGRR
jgi:ketosteroid isomerase-like protein